MCRWENKKAKEKKKIKKKITVERTWMGKKREREKERFTGDIRAKPIVIRPRKERKRGKETGREKMRDEGGGREEEKERERDAFD